jgi:glutamate-1-semialdehyde 2,1-aminomutase
MTATEYRRTAQDELMERALRVVPGGVYGHANFVPARHPRFFAEGEGCRVRDVDGNEYIDLMCSYGPNLLGMRHERVEAAAEAQRRSGNCFTGPTERWVELAEALVERISHADWAMFQKNGTDATTLCLTLARAKTGRRKILVAEGAYHGAIPWCTPSTNGVLPEDRAHLLHYRYNDLDSVREAVEQAGDDLAGVMVSPFRHDTFVDQEMPTPEFAQGLRDLCDGKDAVLMMDEVRGGFRTARGGSWERLGVEPDLSAWGKALGNGYPISAIVGAEHLRETAAWIYSTGSFWYSAVPMAAALECLAVADELDLPTRLEAVGRQLRDGLDELAGGYGFTLRQTGPPQMPQILFDGDDDFAKGTFFAEDALARGVYFHPFHNMFMSAAHTPEVVDECLERLEASFVALREHLGG